MLPFFWPFSFYIGFLFKKTGFVYKLKKKKKKFLTLTLGTQQKFPKRIQKKRRHDYKSRSILAANKPGANVHECFNLLLLGHFRLSSGWCQLIIQHNKFRGILGARFYMIVGIYDHFAAQNYIVTVYQLHFVNFLKAQILMI